MSARITGPFPVRVADWLNLSSPAGPAGAPPWIAAEAPWKDSGEWGKGSTVYIPVYVNIAVKHCLMMMTGMLISP